MRENSDVLDKNFLTLRYLNHAISFRILSYIQICEEDVGKDQLISRRKVEHVIEKSVVVALLKAVIHVYYIDYPID